MSESSEYRQAQTSAPPEKAPEKAPEKTSNSSVEIARLMREGGPEGREKARELLQAAMDGNGVSSQTTSKGTRP